MIREQFPVSSRPVAFAVAGGPRSTLSPTVRWARQAWHGRLGRYVAVRMRDGMLEVAIAESPALRWVRATIALSDSDAERWALEGFLR